MRCLPDTVQYRAVRKYSNVHIWHNDIVKVTFLLIGEEQIRHPHPVGFRESEILQPASVIIKLQSFIQPLLSERQLNTVLLQDKSTHETHAFIGSAINSHNQTVSTFEVVEVVKQ